jgi:hypothetical protein
MRHFIGVVLALALLAALFFAGGWGIERYLALHGHALTSGTGLTAVTAVAGTGLLLGILLAVPRISPLATGLPGLLLLGWSALIVVHSSYATRYLPLPGSTFTAGLTYLLLNGVLALLGAAMIIPLAVPSRWRRRPEDEAEDDLDDLDVHAALGLTP